MILQSSRLVDDAEAWFLIELINRAIKVNLPGVTGNYQDLIYSIKYVNGKLCLHALELGPGTTLNAADLWHRNGCMVIAKCLPKFIGRKAAEHRDLISITTTNSNSFIWLLDDIVEDSIKEDIQVKSFHPVFTMEFANLQEHILTAEAVTADQALAVWTPNAVQPLAVMQQVATKQLQEFFNGNDLKDVHEKILANS